MLAQRAFEREQSLRESRGENAELGDLLKDVMVEPYPFQKAGVAYLQSRKRGIIGDEPGLGKTIQALMIVHVKQSYPCIAVVPATLKTNWRKEARRCIPELGAPDAVQILSGESMKDKKGNEIVIDPKAKMIIINFDILPIWLPKLVALKARSIIIDESQFVKNMDSQRTKAALELAAGARYEVKEGNKRATRTQVNPGIEYRYLLSGTPMPNRILELESQLDILGMIEMFGGKGGFRMRFCGPEAKTIYVRGGHGETKQVFSFKGASHVDELQRRLRETVMVRRLKDDVLTELPPKRHQCIELPNEELKHFVDEENEIEARYAKSIADLKVVVEQARISGNEASFQEASARLKKQYEAHFTEMARLAHDVGMAKVPYVIQMCLEILEGEEKIAVAAHHHDVEDALIAAFEAAGIKTVALTGRESPKKKDAAIEAFMNGDARVFIAGMKCGIGYTITRASRMVQAEMDWTPGVMDQTSDRIHRIGQKDSVLITYVTLENSLDAKKVGMLVAKRDVAFRALDKTLEDFNVPSGFEEKKEKPQGDPTHVFAILERLGIKENQIPF
jgi:SWI/SNF-related matrix-associated actin-dependent regulator 1 of chromatin subfamily A